MSNNDTFEPRAIILILDKPYLIKFTMGVVYTLEKIYGTFRNAGQQLCSDNVEIRIAAVVDFLYALLAVEKSFIYEHMNINKFIAAFDKITEAITQHFPEADKNLSDIPDEPWDWDWLYYVARYRLNMTDNEFLDCTPRRFNKLNYLWNLDHGLVKGVPEKVFIDRIAF